MRQSTFVLIGLLALDACATATGPPGKPQAQLDYENNFCSIRASRMYRFADVNLAYAQCMVGFGNTVRLPDGRTVEPHYVYAAPSPQYYQPPQYTPPEAVPNTPLTAPEPSAPPTTPQTPTGHKWVFTEEQKERFAKDFAIQSAKAYLICRGDEHRWRCAAVSIVKGMGPDEREAVCTDPDILHDFLHMSEELEHDIVQLLDCSA